MDNGGRSLNRNHLNSIVRPRIRGCPLLPCAAVLNGRRAAGADTEKVYVQEAITRVNLAFDGQLPRRPLGKKIYVPGPNDKIAKRPAHFGEENGDIPSLDFLH
jgi:hypothetical protein